MVEPTGLSHSKYVEPLEHALAIAAVLVITAAFLRYILDDPVLPRRYLFIGLGVAITGYIASAIWWPRQIAADPTIRFNQTAPAWFLNTFVLIFIAAAMIILIRKRGWLRNIVLIALSFLFLSELITLINYVSGHAYGHVLCPIGNNLHIWAVPIFGLVYFREQAIEKRQAETALRSYRDRLQDLVDERTAELQRANKQLERAAVLEERQRIAAEMHDGLAQTLSTMSLKTGQAALLLQDGQVDTVLDEFDDMQDVIARAVGDVRRSIASLQQSPQPRQSLQDALQQTAAEISLCDGELKIEHAAIDEPLFLNVDDQEQVLRVVQEALLNACRHAQADHIVIRLNRSPGGFTVAVEDDGLGFDLEEVARSNGNHFGLSIMRARAARLNGRLAIKTRSGSGTSVELSWLAEFDLPVDGDQSAVEELSFPS
jgi:signal transduction histidine kinase